MKVSKLFHKCVYEITYNTDWGNDVNMAFNVAGRTLYIYFQGSNSKRDLIENFKFWPRVREFFKSIFRRKPNAYSNAKIRYHGGFLECYETVRWAIEKTITKVGSRGFAYDNIIVVGYSHGAALAGMCYETCKYFRPDAVVKGYCFEAPRWLYKSKEYLDRWNGCKVFVNHSDIVTHCPPKLLGFVNAGNYCYIGKHKKYGPIKSHYPDKVYESLLEWEKSDEI